MEKSLFYQVLDIAKQENCENEQTIKDLITLAKNELKRDRDKGLIFTKHIKLLIDKQISSKTLNKSFFYQCLFNVLVAETPYSLDSYFQALEFNRPLQEQFYLPRRKQLKPIVDALEDLLIYDKLDELFTSEPPRVGKTTLAVFVLTWQLGMYSEKSNLYSSCSGQLVNTFYKGLSEILTDEFTYQWHKIFPNTKFDKNTFVNSKECSMDTGRIKRYHSFTGRSIDAESLNGACDCNGILLGDDLCSGIEEALNQTRLNALWLKVNNNLLTRAKMGAKKWWIGTRWSLGDPIARRLASLEGSTVRYRVVNIPALNEKDESNFDYLYGVGFSTEYFQDRRRNFEQSDDDASWLAQYMGEPVERTGLLFPIEELNTYGGILPSGEPDRVWGYCDIAWGGGDYTVFPVLVRYGEEVYCPAIVCDNGDKTITQPKVVDTIIRHNVGSIRFEKNAGGQEYKEAVDKKLKERGWVINSTSVYHSNANNKEVRIFETAPEVRKIKFLDPALRDSDYQKAMRFLCSYSITGKNKCDDVPDAFSGGIEMDRDVRRTVEVSFFARPF